MATKTKRKIMELHVFKLRYKCELWELETTGIVQKTEKPKL